MEDRKKAQDVFNESSFLFGEKVSFEAAFPEIETIRIEVNERGRGVHSWSNPRIISRKVGEYINCSNAICYNGGFSIGDILRSMYRDKKEHSEEHKLCKGYEGSPKGVKKYRECINEFEVKVDITYKEIRDK